ncbi:MAG: SDR family oxidoreductase [Ramlibacter sp.]
MALGHFRDLAGRSVAVTGGASGIGAELVRALHASGARVAFLDKQEEAGAELAASLGGDQPPFFLHCDLMDLTALRRALDSAAEAHGLIGVMVNNAAVDQRQDFATLQPADFDWMMGVNLRHVVFACQHVLPGMKARGGGSIINVSSGAWVRGIADLELYSAAKAAIVGFSNALARDAGPHRVRVNAVAPGAVFTERQRRLWHTPEAEARMLAQQCIPDPVEPQDLAELVLFLASDASRAITKQFIAVNAGSL